MKRIESSRIVMPVSTGAPVVSLAPVAAIEADTSVSPAPVDALVGPLVGPLVGAPVLPAHAAP
ncbi:MAG: hypothetical protein IPO88_13245 [Nannocystis sp.]|uniref:hypothetical protein n=1 Tax=Nannocystis sp. TaxID=1962667 RepID=UPI002427995B|nr:hypothetical protein [Nannocystis sp.]MBK9754449.1 hypothetical protein [Nannocystis sp.]